MKPIANIALILLIIFTSVVSVFSQKKIIKSQDDVPRFTYELPASASEVFASKESMNALVVKLQADYEKLLQEYDIETVYVLPSNLLPSRCVLFSALAIRRHICPLISELDSKVNILSKFGSALTLV